MSETEIDTEDTGANERTEATYNDDLEMDLADAFDDVAEKSQKDPLAAFEQEDVFAKPSEPSAEGEQPKTQETQQNQVKTTQSESVYTPPNRWTKQQKEWFGTLPPTAQEALSKAAVDQERYFTQVTQQLSAREKYAKELEEAIPADLRENWELKGYTPASAVRALAIAQKKLDTNPVEGLRHIAASYGITFQQLAQLENQSSQKIDPAIQTLAQQIDELKRQQTTVQQQNIRAVQAATYSELQNFAEETDQNGQLIRSELQNPQFVAEMQPILSAKRAQNPGASARQLLEDAYQATLWASPTFREQQLQRQRLVEEQRRQQDRKTRGIDAQRAAVSLSSSPGGSANHAVPESIDGAIMRAAQELGLNW